MILRSATGGEAKSFSRIDPEHEVLRDPRFYSSPLAACTCSRSGFQYLVGLPRGCLFSLSLNSSILLKRKRRNKGFLRSFQYFCNLKYSASHAPHKTPFQRQTAEESNHKIRTSRIEEAEKYFHLPREVNYLATAFH